MRKRILAGILSLVMILALLPVSALAADGAPVTVATVDDLKNALNNATSDTTIQLTADIGDDANRLSGVTLNKDIKLTLDLNGHKLYITGNQTSHGVVCAITQSQGSLEVISSGADKGVVDCKDGGFIKQDGSGLIPTSPVLGFSASNVEFLCGTTTSSMLYLRAMSEATLTDCNFTGGKGVPYKYSSNNGSVSYAGNVPIGNKNSFKTSKTKLTVTHCNFTNNHTGIALGLGNDYEINIADSAFEGCDFGISHNEGNTSLASNLAMTISGTTFKGNSHGLLLRNTSYNVNTVGLRDVTITGCTFEKNKVTTPVKINWSNTGGNSGAAIYYEFLVGSDPNFTDDYKDKLTISDCTFTENNAGMSGGAIYLPSSRIATTAKISDCTFTNNKAGNDGEAIYLGNNVENVMIENSTISGSPSGYYAAIFVSGGKTKLLNCDIKNNGAGIRVSKPTLYDADVTLEGVKIEDNEDYGIYGSISSLTVKDSGKTSSSISNNGSGGLFFYEGNIVVEGNTKIENNTSQSNGAGISMRTSGADNPSLSIQDNVSIQGNHTSGYAGGIYIEKGVLDVDDNVIFCNNMADSGGADIWYRKAVTSVKLPAPADMNQKYLADGKNETITGWYKDFSPRYADADPKVSYDYTKHIGTGDVLLVAAYTPVTRYDVSFNLNYDDAPTATVQKVENGKTATEPDPAPTREGYVFKGWYTEATGGDKYDFSQSVTADTTLYAHWVKTYTVSYHLDDGKGAEGADYTEKTVEENTEITLAAAPTKDGYTFTGWSDGTNTYQPGATLTVNGDITLTAQWRKNSSGGTTYYTLHYESNGGTQYKDERHRRNTVVNLDKVPVREGYQFTGWYGDKDLTEQVTSVKMTGDKTVYAGWHKSTVPDMLNGEDHFAYVIGYGDGTVHPGADISRAEVATIFFRLLKPEIRDGNLTDASPFADVSQGMWCNKAIATMAKLGIVKGRTAETFDPSAPITRAEFAAICARFDTGMTQGSSNFTDLAGHWAKEEIERAVSLGWIMGYADGTFRPDNPITRAEAMTMINRVLCRIPEDGDDLLPGMKTWPDNQPGDWYYLAVQEATNSHEFQHKGEIHEHWTKLTADPDWTRYQG